MRFVVNRYKNELSDIQVLYSMNTKKEPAGGKPPQLTDLSAAATDSEISIARVLEMVNQFFPDSLNSSIEVL